MYNLYCFLFSFKCFGFSQTVLREHPELLTFSLIVVHLYCSTATDLLALQPILFQLSERVLQSE